jgi:tetratricopeptide (TPR) repeat protein
VITTIIVVVVAILLVVAIGVAFLRGAAYPRAKVERLLLEARYDEAASVAMEFDRLEEACEYYLRAQKPARAAQLLARLGQPRRAAELYERAGEAARAAHCYDQAGMKERAEEVRRGNPVAMAQSGGSAPASTRDRADATPAAPPSRAQQAEADFRAASATAGATEADQSRVREMAREAAEALLGDGEIRRAADVYRDGGLDEEAVHLYVNVLGAPGDAAPLLAAAGNHERAAELYELAGQKERAAGAWATVAREMKDPERYVDRIEALSNDVLVSFLEETLGAEAATGASAELHYRLGNALARKGDTAKAIERLAALQRETGGYKDAAERIDTLSHAPAGDGAARKSVVPDAPGSEHDDLEIAAADLDSLAREVARSAQDRAKGGDLMSQLAASDRDALADAVASRVVGAVQRALVVGLEYAPAKMDLVADSSVRAARAGPSIDTLRRYIGGRACDLQNIEVFFRLGLAHLGAGQWESALAAFEAVEEASPGYRDALQRAEEIRGWQKALGSRSVLGATSGEARGRYVLLGELGRGGMAVVYRANDRILGREVALKFMAEELGTSAEMKELFQREARSIAQLNHPNIVTVYDFGVLEGRLFIAMEYIEGKSMERMGAGGERAAVVEILRIARQVLDALAYAHGRKIIHRDIKPANMIRTTAGVLKLMDFGLAKSIEAGAGSSMVAGTPEYMAPEQLRGEKVDHRADLFSAGVSLYELLTGQLPFEGMERKGPPPRPRSLVPSLPEVLDDAVMRAVALDREERFQSAADFAKPLRSILEKVDRRVTMVGMAATMYSGPPPEGTSEESLAKTARGRPKSQH